MTERHGLDITLDGTFLDVTHYLIPDATVAVLVLPGGGFREHTLHDGIGYAEWLNTIGISAAVLHYQLRPDPFPLALRQARAVLDAMQTEPRLGYHSASVGVMGSSAGGLLAGLLATSTVLSIEDPPQRVPRPEFHAQSYGLADLSLLPSSAVEALLGERMQLVDELSPITHVDQDTAPTFVWSTAQDPPGLPNALAWAHALARHEVPVELHIYPEGWHGVGLANGVPYGAHGHEHLPRTAQWTAAFERWVVHTFDVRESSRGERSRQHARALVRRIARERDVPCGGNSHARPGQEVTDERPLPKDVLRMWTHYESQSQRVQSAATAPSVGCDAP